MERTAVRVRIPWTTFLTGRLRDYLTLTKPKISALALVTVLIGYTLAHRGSESSSGTVALDVLIGVWMIASSASAINQILERETDSLMTRTRNRPLPEGRIGLMEALGFAIFAGLAGTIWLYLKTNPTTTLLALMTWFLYSLVYTPFKRVSVLNTVVGAVPGALPPVIGWTASGGQLDVGAFTLFSIMYLWQFPHFMAIAWLYREEYRRAGMRMVSVKDQYGQITGLIAVSHALVLLVVSFLPRQIGLAGLVYFGAAWGLGLLYLVASIRFWLAPGRDTARVLLFVSLVYLPLLLGLLTADHIRLLQ